MGFHSDLSRFSAPRSIRSSVESRIDALPPSVTSAVMLSAPSTLEPASSASPVAASRHCWPALTLHERTVQMQRNSQRIRESTGMAALLCWSSLALGQTPPAPVGVIATHTTLTGSHAADVAPPPTG